MASEQTIYRHGRLATANHAPSVVDGQEVPAHTSTVLRGIKGGRSIEKLIGTVVETADDGTVSTRNIWQTMKPGTQVNLTDAEADAFRASVESALKGLSKEARAKLPQDRNTALRLMERIMLATVGITVETSARGRSAAADPTASLDFEALAAELGIA